jgi:predicted esterase
MVRHVLDEAGEQFGIPPERRVLVGFSQAVALNYRFASTYPDAIRGLIAICGGLPGTSRSELRSFILPAVRMNTIRWTKRKRVPKSCIA